jgi:hypothetical protein
MTHPLVDQLRFTRSELRRALAGIADDEARVRFGAINSISWIICHLAGQERRYWLIRAQGIADLVPELDEWGGYGKPASTPPLVDSWAAYDATIAAVDPFIDGLTTERLREFLVIDGRQHDESIGTMLQRVIYHYWFHIGEAYAIRQMLGHTDLPEFVGDIGMHAPFDA